MAFFVALFIFTSILIITERPLSW